MKGGERREKKKKMAPVVVTPDDWGVFLWHMMYIVSVGMSGGEKGPSSAEQEGFKEFIQGLSKVLPCSLCRSHFAKQIKTHPIDKKVTQSRDGMIRWVLRAHNDVRRRQGKPLLETGDIHRMIVQNHSNQNPQILDKLQMYGPPLLLGIGVGAGLMWLTKN